MTTHSTSLVQAPDARHRMWQGICSCGWLGLPWNAIGSARNEAAAHEREKNREAS